ncbi:MAG: amidohydrolase family protein, partial [Candidatus Promineifilaceae bacterium]
LWPDERVGLQEMVRSFTANGAFANFLEGEIGSLVAGKRADLIVLARNLFDIPPEEISAVKVLLTIVDGQVVYIDEDFDRKV